VAKISGPPPVDPGVVRERFSALRIQQPIGEIYIARMTAEQVQRVTFFDVRRRIQEERDIERYLGIQRPLDDKRVESLKKYVNYSDAAFPTAIIVAVDAEYAEFREKESELILTNTRKGATKPDTAIRGVCRVIDGQHRIAGLEGFRGKNFEVVVSVFVGSDISDQAYIFATVNLEQNKVNRSLAYDLFELARKRSPYKTCHNITVALDRNQGGPFYLRVKRLGVSTEGREGELLTQATFVNGLIGYISDDPKLDRDLLLNDKKLEKVSGAEARRLCFRNLFIDEEDIKIGKIVEEYFKAVRTRWERAWVPSPGHMLNRTNGFRALIRLFGRAYTELGKPGDFISAENFKTLFDRVDVNWDYFTTDRFQPGSSGESDLRRFLEEEIFGAPKKKA
jgi:DGQHR domain-containing protein